MKVNFKPLTTTITVSKAIASEKKNKSSKTVTKSSYSKEFERTISYKSGDIYGTYKRI